MPTCRVNSAMTDTGDCRLLPLAHALDGELHVWLADPDAVHDPGRLEAYRSMLADDELARLRRYRFERDRHLYLVAHALVRVVLSRYAAVPPRAWRFTANRYGRPEIVAPLLPVALRFNLSHTPGLTACVVTREHDCGIDVERISAQRNSRGVAERMFPPQEWQRLAALAPAAAVEQFFAYWTLHEALGKALGEGLARTGRQYVFDGQGTGDYMVATADGAVPADDWWCSVLRPAPQHLLAVAVRGIPPGKALRVVSWLVP
jgi:4'-phosphopantetheinyl transferase